MLHMKASITAAYDLAVQHHRQGNFDLAADLYRRILAAEPDHAKSLHLLGVIDLQRGDPAAAIARMTQALAMDDSLATCYSNLGAAYRAVGRFAEAEATSRRAVELLPDFAMAHLNLGLSLVVQDRSEEAIGYFQKALQLQPGDAGALRGLAHALAEVGRVEEAVAVYRQMPGPDARVLQAIQLPLVYNSTADIQHWRARLIAEVDQLLAEGFALDIAEKTAFPVFSLAHQGFDDCPVQRKLARLFRAPAAPSVTPGTPRPGDGRIRVGFLSSYFNRHTIGKLTRGLIAHLSRDRFRVVVLSIGSHSDDVALFIRKGADEYLELPRDLPNARQIIVDAQLDILFYCDLGMDPISYTLAFSRLAPVQCTTWGHPSTTGMDTMDYFISSDLIEIEGAQTHYSERLVRLPSLTFYYYRPQPPQPLAGRSRFGLSETATLYVCPQSIYKFHPEFDPLLADILRRDPNGQVILIRWAYAGADALLRERFARGMPDVADRIRFIERLQQPEFLNLLAVSDVLLDPVHFGGGWTGCEGISLGVPIVTLPSQFLRGRITAAMYRKIGVLDCIAESPAQYVEIAVRLGTDRDYRRQIHEKILASADRLFEDSQAITALEEFFHNAASRKQKAEG